MAPNSSRMDLIRFLLIILLSKGDIFGVDGGKSSPKDFFLLVQMGLFFLQLYRFCRVFASERRRRRKSLINCTLGT